MNSNWIFWILVFILIVVGVCVNCYFVIVL